MKLNTRSFNILSVVQIIYILFCSIYFLLQFIFSKVQKYMFHLYFSLSVLHWLIGPKHVYHHAWSPEKVTLMILYTSILAQFWSRPYIVVRMLFNIKWNILRPYFKHSQCIPSFKCFCNFDCNKAIYLSVLMV